MNNLVFNTVASRLYTTVANATLTVNGEVEITNTPLNVTGEVDITNTTLNVTGEVEINTTVVDVLVTNTTLNVTGEVEITNTTLNVTGEVEITNTLLDISVAGHTITSDTDSQNNVTGTGALFDDTDISQITTGTFFVYNTGANTFTVSLQISPTTDDNRYISDPDNDDLALDSGDGAIIVISKYGNYARLMYEAVSAATMVAYYNGQM
jgi:hypothetical protein